MVRMTEAQVPTALEKLALRTGGCDALKCQYGCKGFALVNHLDGFPTCICGHTQYVHGKSGA